MTKPNPHSAAITGAVSDNAIVAETDIIERAKVPPPPAVGWLAAIWRAVLAAAADIVAWFSGVAATIRSLRR